MSSDSKVSEGFNELRLKSYELERLQLVHEEIARNLSSANHENEKLRKQKEVGSFISEADVAVFRFTGMPPKENE